MKHTVVMPSALRIMISGPMTGYPDFNRPAFNDAAEDMRQQGFIVYNPATLPDGWSHDEYLTETLRWVDEVDALFLLDDWQHSKGAVMEFDRIISRRVPVLKFQSMAAFRAALERSKSLMQLLVKPGANHA